MPRRALRRGDKLNAADLLEPEGPAGRRGTVLSLALLVTVTCGAYFNADHEEFLFDSIVIAKKERRTDDFGFRVAALVRRAFRPGEELTYVTFAANCALNRALGREEFDISTFLAGNVTLHALNACLVYFLLGGLLGRGEAGRRQHWIPLAVAVLFAVHPMQASSVAYIIQRRGLLATTFYLLGVLAYLRARDFRGAVRRPGRGETKSGADGTGSISAWPWQRVAVATWVALCYWLSFRSKSLGLSLPIAILAIEFCLRAPDRKALRHYLGWMAAGVLATTGAMFAYLWWIDVFDPKTMRMGLGGSSRAWGPWTHFLTESRVFLHYWKLLLLPLPRWSCIDHEFLLSTHLGEHYAIVAVAAHGALLSLATVGALKGRTVAAMGVFWFYIALIPYVVLPQKELLVEYKTYLPSVGLGMILAGGLRSLRYRVPLVWQVPAWAVVAVVLLGTTLSRNVIYQSAFDLWSDAARKSPTHPRVFNCLGGALTDLGRYDEAVAALEKSLRLNPYSSDAHNDLAHALVMKGKMAEALKHCGEALRLNPDSALVHQNLGMVLMALNRWDEAERHFAKAIQIDPYMYGAYNNLGTARAREGRWNEALKLFGKALEANPDYAEAHCNLGWALARRGEFDLAMEHLNTALRLQPDFSRARAGVAMVQTAKRRPRDPPEVPEVDSQGPRP